MRNFMKGFALLACLILTLVSCEQKPERNSIVLSPKADSILRDTIPISLTVDSLRKKFYEVKEDTAAIDILNLLAEKISSKLKILNAEAEKQSEKKNYAFGELWAATDKGYVLYMTGKPDSAILVFDSTISTARKNKLPYMESKAMCWKGNALLMKQDLKGAEETQKGALTIARQNNFDYLSALALNNLGQIQLVQYKFREAVDYFSQSIVIAKKIRDNSLIAVGYGTTGESFRMQSKFDSAIINYTLASEFALREGNLHIAISCLEYTAQCYRLKGDYVKALDFSQRALANAETGKFTRNIIGALNECGELYRLIKENEKAIPYFERALKLNETTGDTQDMILSYSNLGEIYSQEKDFAKAEENLDKAIELCKTINDKTDVSFCFAAKGTIAEAKNENDKAIQLYQQAVDSSKAGGEDLRVGIVSADLSRIYLKTGNLAKSKEYAEQSFNYSKKVKTLDLTEKAAEVMYRMYEMSGDYRNALEMHKLFKQSTDSLVSDDNVKRFAAKENEGKENLMKAEQKTQDAIYLADKKRKDAEISQQKTIRNFSLAGSLLLILLASFIYRSLVQNRKAKRIIELQKIQTEEQRDHIKEQKNEIEIQKHIVEEKNKEVLDSISYAKRLQDAILPPLKLIGEILPDCFVLYKPKDIVAGDFYWMERSGDLIYFAAADCTGHGVPGAMVSVVCSNALNRAVKEFHISDPGKILDKTRELVVETFARGESEVKDGMDISLIALNKKTGEVKWSGANNPLWYVQNGAIMEITANKQPIGKTDKPSPFETHTIRLAKNDSLYLFTDGYADQFGGPKGKKFMYKKMNELLFRNHALPMDDQKNLLDKTIEEWKGSLEQVDDICIVGIRF